MSKIVWWSCALSAGITAVSTIVLLLYPRALLVLFTTDEAVLLHGAEYLRIMVFGYVPMALMFTIGGVMRGAGDTAANMWITLGSLWGVRVPLAWALSTRYGLGLHGIWWAMVSGTVTGFVLNYIYYRTGRWKRYVVVRQEPTRKPEPTLRPEGV